MSARIKISRHTLADIRADLSRAHAFAHERVGFLTAGVTRQPDGALLLLARDYLPVEDGDYRANPSVGAEIGADAIRKGLQAAYKGKSALLHLHSHGGGGRPEFSAVDLEGGRAFVPSFFNAVPQMPHGILVLSNDSARGLLWTHPKEQPTYIAGFVQVGVPFRKFGETA